MPAPAYTAGPVSLALGTSSVPILAFNPLRIGAFICNATTLSTVCLGVGGDVTASKYSWRLKPGEQVMLPLYGAIQELRAVADVGIVLGGGLTVTEFTN